MEIKIRFDKYVSDQIFDTPIVKRKVEHLFDWGKPKIEERIEEIEELLELPSELSVSKENVLFYFKNLFYKDVLTEAIYATLNSRENNYDIVSRLIKIMNRQRFANQISGELMIDAYVSALQEISKRDALQATIAGSKIFLLKRGFLNKHKRTKVEKVQYNFSNKKHCSCECKADCEGDTNKCTSKKAKECECEHECYCYFEPLAKKDT